MHHGRVDRCHKAPGIPWARPSGQPAPPAGPAPKPHVQRHRVGRAGLGGVQRLVPVPAQGRDRRTPGLTHEGDRGRYRTVHMRHRQLTCGEDWRDVDGTGVAETGAGAADVGTESLGCAQRAVPGAPRTLSAQPAADSAVPTPSVTTSANNPRVRTLPLPVRAGGSLAPAGVSTMDASTFVRRRPGCRRADGLPRECRGRQKRRGPYSQRGSRTAAAPLRRLPVRPP